MRKFNEEYRKNARKRHTFGLFQLKKDFLMQLNCFFLILVVSIIIFKRSNVFKTKYWFERHLIYPCVSVCLCVCHTWCLNSSSCLFYMHFYHAKCWLDSRKLHHFNVRFQKKFDDERGHPSRTLPAWAPLSNISGYASDLNLQSQNVKPSMINRNYCVSN